MVALCARAKLVLNALLFPLAISTLASFSLAMPTGNQCQPYPNPALGLTEYNLVHAEFAHFLEDASRSEKNSALARPEITAKSSPTDILPETVSIRVKNDLEFLFGKSNPFRIEECADATCNGTFATLDGERRILLYSKTLIESVAAASPNLNEQQNLLEFTLVHEVSHFVYERILLENQGWSLLGNTTLADLAIPANLNEATVLRPENAVTFQKVVSVFESAGLAHSEVDLLALELIKAVSGNKMPGLVRNFNELAKHVYAAGLAAYPNPSEFEKFMICMGMNETKLRAVRIGEALVF
jgi:hypothetical protein